MAAQPRRYGGGSEIVNQIELSIEQKLSLAQSFVNHPVQGELIDYKIKYINVLEWFVNRFSPNDIFSKQLLGNYKVGLLGVEAINYQYNDNIEELLKITAKLRLKKWHWFSYRYLLLIDILFLCSFFDPIKANIVVEEYKKQLKLWFYKNKYYRNFNELISELYVEQKRDLQFDAIDDVILKWQKNLEFIVQTPKKILITANMSAGKSTLINALTGKRIVKTQNMACTSKVHYIYSKAFEDEFNYKIDGEVCLNADINYLMNNSESNTDNKILASTYFRNFIVDKPLCLIDTPGVNYSGNISHQKITQEVILEKDYDLLIYIMNAEYLGTDDEHRHLKFIADNVKDKKIVVAVNKLDRFNAREDDVTLSVNEVFNDLKKFNLNNYRLCPISAYAGLLAKEKLWHDDIDEFDVDELELIRRKLKKEKYNLSSYYSDILLKDSNNRDFSKSDKKYFELLANCGILPFEKLITE